MNPQNVLVIIPTYNEAVSISAVAAVVLGRWKEISLLIVDDNSPDGTASIVRDSFPQEARLSIIRRERKNGIGAAYLEGMQWGLQKGFDLFIQMDGDSSHDPAQIEEILHRAEQHDFIVLSRWIDGAGAQGMSKWRHWLSDCCNRIACFLLRVHVKDLTSGYCAFSSRVLSKILNKNKLSSGYAFQIQLKCYALFFGFKAGEIPIRYRRRIGGSSKLTLRIFAQTVFSVSFLVLRRLLGRVS